MRTLLCTSILLLAMLVTLTPSASAADADLRDCVAVDPNGDPITVSVSPSGCYEVGRPVWNAWNEECRWLMQSPHWPDHVWCNDDL